jgi:hypothetical protein
MNVEIIYLLVGGGTREGRKEKIRREGRGGTFIRFQPGRLASGIGFGYIFL